MTDAQVSGIISALSKLPATAALVFHGLPGADGVAEITEVRTIVATSYDARVATENFSVAAIAAIVVKEGRYLGPLSRFPDEQELVVLPGSVLRRVSGFELPDGTPVVVLEELSPAPLPEGFPGSLEALVDAIAARIEQQRAAGAVDVTSPGKFASELE
jgi:hypothetical protein